ncbi:MAG: hypothetical protein B7X00_00960 [Legionella sp. 21-45-4]|nr:MAG: hypothetical protein B7X00_00960 [Legionella sp. 21-45-4]
MWAVAKQAYCNRETFIAGIYASLMNMAVAIFGAVMGQLYLMQRLDVSQESAAFVNGMLFLGAMLGGPLIGWWSDQLGSRLLPMKYGALISCVLIGLVLYAPISITGMAILFFLLGFTTSSQVISFAFVAEKSSPLVVASSISLVSILLQGGYILYQNMFSYVLVHGGNMHMINHVPVYSYEAYQSAVLILPISFLLALGCVFFLKEARKPRQIL